jgi:uncharacterized protein (TIGR01777 family)
MYKKKVVVAGATGSIGKALCNLLHDREYEINVVTRDVEKAKSQIPFASAYKEWNLNKAEELSLFLEGANAVINLAGAPIFEKWRGNYEQVVVDSRVKGTEYIVNAISQCSEKPSVLINGSAAGFYGYSKGETYNEGSLPGNDFWAHLVKDWESAAHLLEKDKVRVVTIRTTLVLANSGGALDALVPYFEKGLGGYVRPGDQVFPWIHMDDEIGLILATMENTNFVGAINCVAGNVTSRDFSQSVGKAMTKRSSFPIPSFIIKSLFGRASDLVLKSQTIKSTRMDELSFELKYKNLDEAMESILKK